jgi:hypothetical protein
VRYSLPSSLILLTEPVAEGCIGHRPVTVSFFMAGTGERERPLRVLSEADMLAITLQSVVLAASVALNAVILGRRMLAMSIATAVAAGLFAGIIAAFPALRVVARSDGVELNFFKWLVIGVVSAAVAFATMTALQFGMPFPQ